MAKCPICGMMVDEKKAPSSEHMGITYYFMDADHKATFDKDPEKYCVDMKDDGDHEHHM